MTEWFSWESAPPGDFAVIGDPVSHSLSPVMHQAAYQALGIERVYRAIRVPLGEVDIAVEHLSHVGYGGLNVTVPLKEEATTLAGFRYAPFVGRVGAVNTLNLSQKQGINTDAPGFLSILKSLGEVRKVLLLGAGGTARALAWALVEEGYVVTLWNRTRERAERLQAELDQRFEIVDVPRASGAEVVVNTTSAGLEGDAPPMTWDASPLAIDLFYREGLTPFLEQAAAAGCQTLDGRRLLVEQGALSLEWWLGLPAPREAMAAAIGHNYR